MMLAPMRARRTPHAVCMLAFLCLVRGFSVQQGTTRMSSSPPSATGKLHTRNRLLPQLCAQPRRYGPPLDEQPSPTTTRNSSSSPSSVDEKVVFREMVENVMNAKDPQHIPSLLTQHIDWILTFDNSNRGAAMVEDLLADATDRVGAEGAEAYKEAIELILGFAENFVQVAEQMDTHNKELLGKIFRILSTASGDTTSTSLEREETLNQLLIEEKENLTSGFLRHLEGECTRIASAPTITPESTRLIGILRMVQTRVLEELGKDLGEAAQVLSQLISYETETERKAVLDAGLVVRGPGYAKEMLDLTEEALRGFRRAGADAELVKRVEQIDTHIRDYLKAQNIEVKGRLNP